MEDSRPFDWYQDTMEVEISEYHPPEKKRTLMQRMFDLTIKGSNYVSGFTGILLIFRYIVHAKAFKILDITFDLLLSIFLIYFGSLGVIVSFTRLISYVSTKFGENIAIKVECAHRWLALSIWYWVNLYLLDYVEKDLGWYSSTARSYLQSGLLTSLSFAGVSVAMAFFYESFIQKSLSAKMRDVEMSERVLAAMKNYRYELSESSSVVSEECNCLDILLCRTVNEEENDEHIALNRRDTQVGNLYLKVPELQSLYDAKTLAKDVFEKAAEGGSSLPFDSFAQIFPNDQIALQAFPYFESSGCHEVQRKEFRDTIIQFYVDRMNLEKGFDIAKGFVSIIGDIFNIIVMALLVLAYLVIFGIPVRELLALALSSAFLLNFMISGAATDIYYNILILMTHPFDVGDDVMINDTDFTVYKIGLTSTSFIGPNGGRVKYVNSHLWQQSLVNMTRAPEKIILLTFTLSPDIDILKFQLLKNKIQKYLRERQYDFFETFSLEGKSETSTDINKLECRLVLRCKSCKTRARKFALRVEFTQILNQLIESLAIKTL